MAGLRKCIGLAALVIILSGCAAQPENEYQRYKKTCHDRGGFVTQHSGWSTFDYACVGQTTGAPLPSMRS